MTKKQDAAAAKLVEQINEQLAEKIQIIDISVDGQPARFEGTKGYQCSAEWVAIFEPDGSTLVYPARSVDWLRVSYKKEGE